MAAVSVIAKKVGKGRNATSQKQTVALPIAPDTGNASVDSASASRDGKVIILFPMDLTFARDLPSFVVFATKSLGLFFFCAT